jgi:N-acetylneuraminic acid mutarotase
MPTARLYLTAGVIKGKLYAVGGSSANGDSNVNEAYNPATNTWTTKAHMPTARYGLAAGVIAKILYAVGGQSNNGGYLNTVEAYSLL